MERHLPSKGGKNIITNLAGVLFLVVASLHLVRSIYGWEAYVGDIAIPLWVSWAVVAVTLYLAYVMFRMDKN